jgi:hypothetical protein
MVWTGTAVMVVVAIVAVIVVIVVKRPTGVEELGSVSDHWISRHRSLCRG